MTLHSLPGRRFFALLLLTIFCAFTGAGCGGGEAAEELPRAHRTLVLGVDGLEWDVMLPLLEQGRLPNFAAMMERGQYGILETIEPTFSPVIWTTIATAKPMEEHGIESFAYDTEEGTKLYNAGHRKTKAVWNIYSDYERPVWVIGWWMTYPVEPVDGIMVAQTSTIDQMDIEGGKNVYKGTLFEGVSGQVYPPERTGEMMAVLAEVEGRLPELTREIFGAFPHPMALLGERLWENTQWTFKADATYAAIADGFLEQGEPFELALVYLGGPDVVGHRFWRYKYPELYEHKPTAEEIENFGGMIDDYYVYVDGVLGELMEAAGPETNVMVISDHGMDAVGLDQEYNPDDPPYYVNSGHHKEAEPGVFVAAGPDVRSMAAEKGPGELTREDLPVVGSVYDITPTLLAMQRLPVGRDMQGQVLEGIFVEGLEIEKQPRPVKTHDDEVFLASRPDPEQQNPDLEERLDQLRDLGYIN